MIYTQSSSMVLGRESCSVSTESLTSSALSLTSEASPRKLSSPAQEGVMSDSSTGARRKTPQASKQKKKGSHNIYILYAYCLKHLYLKQVFVVVIYCSWGHNFQNGHFLNTNDNFRNELDSFPIHSCVFWVEPIYAHVPVYLNFCHVMFALDFMEEVVFQ